MTEGGADHDGLPRAAASAAAAAAAAAVELALRRWPVGRHRRLVARAVWRRGRAILAATDGIVIIVLVAVNVTIIVVLSAKVVDHQQQRPAFLPPLLCRRRCRLG